MKKLFFLIPTLGMLLLLSDCGPKPVQNGTDKTPPGFIVIAKREVRTQPTTSSSGGVDISTANVEMKISTNDVIHLFITVLDQESGVKDVSFVLKPRYDRQLNKDVPGNMYTACNERAPLTGLLHSSVLTFNKAIGTPGLEAAFTVDLVTDPITQASCALGFTEFDVWIQVSATNGDGLMSTSGELHVTTP